ncbi:MAG: DegT/DnrJ/EryC1/StrS family aminotransferase [Spirochaetales bacterium]|nr:DegT/DnrJ/EryC1/StrS family aminotransferase [Spirochaetales bacterium]
MKANIDFIPFSRPVIGPEEEEAVLRVLRSGWLTTAGETKAFEEEFARYVESGQAVAVNSGTAALHLGLEAMGVGPGDLVVTTPYTFTASAEVIRYLGADPLFCDIQENGFNMDPEQLEQTVKHAPKTPKAVIPVHIAGEPCDMKSIMDIARRYGMKVLEDAAHSFPVKSNDGKWTGTSGHAGAYSFYANKTITTGEGGMLVTNDPDIAKRARIMRLHGIDREIWNRYTAGNTQSWRYAVVEAGYKYNMPDMAAAIGRVQLKKAGEFRSKREDIARMYTEAFSKTHGRWTLPRAPGSRFEHHAWHLYLLSVTPPGGEDGEHYRDRCIEYLSGCGIGTSVHFIPLHIMPYYRARFGFAPQDFPRALSRYQTVISLPIYPALTRHQVDRVVQAVENMP